MQSAFSSRRAHRQLPEMGFPSAAKEATNSAVVGNLSLSGRAAVNHEHFLDGIRATVRENADKIYASWYDIEGKCSSDRTFGQIWRTAGAVAHYLRCEWKVEKGQRVILCYDFGLHFFEVFLGCLRAGVVAVLVYPPAPPLKKSLPKLAKVVEDCEPALILTDTRVKLARISDKFNPLSNSRHLWPNQVEYQATDTLSIKSGLSFDEETSVEDLAFLQYTSGSTGDPKGVMITFNALASNIDLVHHGFYTCYGADGGIPEEIVGFSWLPQYHDLGLIYAGIAPFAAGWRMHMMSPFSFIKNPVLWIELMSRHKVQWGVAPDFSYGLVARKFREAQDSAQMRSGRTNKLPKLDLSSIRYLSAGAEPCRPETQRQFHAVFSAHGLRENWYHTGYGLAENVVGVSWVHGLHLSTPRQEDHSKVYLSAANLSNLYPSLVLKVVDPETCTEVQGDTTGELWIAGPTVAAGYYGKAKLSEQTFKAQLSGMPAVNFLRTGDLAFVQSGHMFICGRIKDLIIVNGVNHYPQDLEFAAQDASNAVRPGCVAAFTANEVEDESSVEVVFEIRKQNITEAEEVCSAVRNAVVQTAGIPISRVVAIAERSIPKTTSGKIQRRNARDALHCGRLEVIYSLEIDEVTVEERVTWDSAAAASLPMDRLPSEVEQAIQTIDCRPDLLECYYRQLQLDSVPGLNDAWANATKSTEALKGMCMRSLEALTQKHPTICQLGHALKKNPHWIQSDDLHGLFSDVAHCAYVLQWVTMHMIENPETMKAKRKSDEEYERCLLDERNGTNFKAVPTELSSLLQVDQPDLMFSTLPFFDWIKLRSLGVSVDWILRQLDEDGEGIGKGYEHSVFLNILEAVWADKANKFIDNAMVGHLLSSHSFKAERNGNRIRFRTHCQMWNDVYVAWNMAFSLAHDSGNSGVWLASKLLVPCILDAPDELFLQTRTISLYLVVSQLLLCSGSQRTAALPSPILSRGATRLFGRLNYDWSLRLGLQANQSSQSGGKLDPNWWLSKFDEWSGEQAENADIAQRTTTPERGGEQTALKDHDFGSILRAMLGANFDEDHTWEDLGLSSMAAIELQNQISEKLLVTLPPTFQEDYPTPRMLRVFVETHSHKRLRVSLPAFDVGGYEPQMEWWLSGAYQFIGVILLLFLVAFSFLPVYHFGELLASMPRINHVTDSFDWQWLPFVVPSWMATFSVTVIIAKWVVIGRYKAQQVSVPSVWFLRWWFIDRLVHVWEIWVGNYIRDTPVIWLFYFLMGVRLHPLAQIDAFVREFDLVEIGAHSKLQYDVTCRRFSAWDNEHGLFLRFRPVRIGSRCKIQGLVGLGASVGDGSHVDRLSAVPEGAQVPKNTRVEGSPAYDCGPTEKSDSSSSEATSLFVFGAIKLLWLVFELYLFFAFLLFGQWVLNGRLPQSFRYTPLLRWVLLLLSSMVLSMLTCIPMKWLLIGKKRTGRTNSTFYAEIADWVVDYHFSTSLTILRTIAQNSKFINIYLMALGMDIDLASHVWAVHCPPSKVNFLSVRRSFFSTIHFDPKHKGIEVSDSSCGINVVLKGGTRLVSSQIAPFSTVDGAVQGNLQPDRNCTMSSGFSNDIFSAILVVFIFWSAVPAYELFQLNSWDAIGIGFSVTKFALVLVVQTVSWLLLFKLLQGVTLRQKEQGIWKTRNQGLYAVYNSFAFSFLKHWSMLPLAWGTPLANEYFKFLGSKVEGRMLYFPGGLYEFPLLTFADGTVVDRCIVTGHAFDASGLELGPTKCAGTLHEGTVVLSHTNLTGADETGPCRFVSQNTKPTTGVERANRNSRDFSPELVLPYGGEDPG